jgi:hypothetical protein
MCRVATTIVQELAVGFAITPSLAFPQGTEVLVARQSPVMEIKNNKKLNNNNTGNTVFSLLEALT